MKRALIGLVSILALTGFTVAPAVFANDSRAQAPKVSLNSVGDKFVGAEFDVVGYLSGTGMNKDKTLKLQQKKNGEWKGVSKQTKKPDGKFTFRKQYSKVAGNTRWRVRVERNGKKITVSKALTIKVIAKPPPGVDMDCSDFPNQEAAQFFFYANDPVNDPHELDTDNDGIACEELIGPSGGPTVTATATATATTTATATATAPGPTTTVTIPGPTTTVTVPGPTATVTVPGPTVTVPVPGPTVTITAPGPTVTVTATETAMVTETATVTATATATVTATETVTETVTPAP